MLYSTRCKSWLTQMCCFLIKCKKSEQTGERSGQVSFSGKGRRKVDMNRWSSDSANIWHYGAYLFLPLLFLLENSHGNHLLLLRMSPHGQRYTRLLWMKSTPLENPWRGLRTAIDTNSSAMIAVGRQLQVSHSFPREGTTANLKIVFMLKLERIPCSAQL